MWQQHKRFFLNTIASITNQFVCWSSITSKTFFSDRSGLTAESGLPEVSDAKKPEFEAVLGAK